MNYLMDEMDESEKQGVSFKAFFWNQQRMYNRLQGQTTNEVASFLALSLKYLSSDAYRAPCWKLSCFAFKEDSM